MARLISSLLTSAGLVLMAAKIHADSEPGAIPLLLVVLGIGGYVATRRRQPADRQQRTRAR